jgi:ribokinase
MVGAIGRDEHGRRARSALAGEGIDLEGVREIEGEPTGIAIIAVGPRGENQIVVAPGANGAVVLDEDDRARIRSADVLLTNHEIDGAVVIEALRVAREAGVTMILNPAPAHALPADVLHLGPILTPNEHELVVAIGNDATDAALDELVLRHAGPIIVTQGPAGALLARGDDRLRFEGRLAPAVVDTTGAGDTFNGVLAAWLAGGATLETSIEAANAAAALSVASAGAREGMPAHEAIRAFLADG